MENNLVIQNLIVKEIFADPAFNCRGAVTPFDVIDLARSIESKGLQQPIVVQPFNKPGYKWRVVMGHRRHKAFEILKYETIPAVVRENLSENEARTINLVENLERKDLTIMQEARAIQKFFTVGINQSEVAKMINKSQGWVSIRFAALQLPKEIQAEIDAGFITQGQIKSIHNIPSLQGKYDVVRELKDAKIRGEKKNVLPIKERKQPKSYEKKLRTQTEMYTMQDIIREAIGNNLGTRCIGWCAGLVSDDDLFEDLETLAKQQGKTFNRITKVAI